VNFQLTTKNSPTLVTANLSMCDVLCLLRCSSTSLASHLGF